MNDSTPKRIEQYKADIIQFEEKVTALNQLLLKQYDHPDRSKYISDKNHWICKINITRKKIENLENNLPELGTGLDFEVETVDTATLKKAQN